MTYITLTVTLTYIGDPVNMTELKNKFIQLLYPFNRRYRKDRKFS